VLPAACVLRARGRGSNSRSVCVCAHHPRLSVAAPPTPPPPPPCPRARACIIAQVQQGGLCDHSGPRQVEVPGIGRRLRRSDAPRQGARLCRARQPRWCARPRACACVPARTCTCTCTCMQCGHVCLVLWSRAVPCRACACRLPAPLHPPTHPPTHTHAHAHETRAQVMLANSVVIKEESDWIEFYYR
jgi:hypothetical protein